MTSLADCVNRHADSPQEDPLNEHEKTDHQSFSLCILDAHALSVHQCSMGFIDGKLRGEALTDRRLNMG